MALNTKRWSVAQPAPPEHFARLPHLHRLIVQTLYNRGIIDPDDVSAFLDGRGAGAINPFTLPDMAPAVTRLRKALRDGEQIVVYGDFDADGVTATALLTQTLRALGGHVRPYIPHRVDEGYGLNEDTLIKLAQGGARLIVTVDCGIRAHKEVAAANRRGLEVIITDHHTVGSRLPDAVAVIDPKRPDSRYPFRELAGVGVAYRLAQALLRTQRKLPLVDDIALVEDDLLDLVALGSVADLVPLVEENRALVQLGLERLNRMERPGIAALCQEARLKPGEVNSTAIGYVLGPRINAAGRLAHAETAYHLLSTDDPAEAGELAQALGRLNRDRQELTRETYERIRQQVAESQGDDLLLFASAPGFVAGVVGLAAGRLVEEFYRPAVVVEVGDEISTGSCRSIPDFHIAQALDECEDLLDHYGGHAAAAGFSVKNAKLDELAVRLREIANDKLAGAELEPLLRIDAEVELGEMTWDLAKALSRLEPCGQKNPQPIFLSRNVHVRHWRAVGKEGRHLKLGLTDGRATWDAIAFRQGAWAGELPDRVDLAYHLEVNEWNGQRRLQLNVQDIRSSAQE